MGLYLGASLAAHSNMSTTSRSAGSGGIDPGVLRLVLLEDVVLDGAAQPVGGTPCFSAATM
jgi:hypothetical protein